MTCASPIIARTRIRSNRKMIDELVEAFATAAYRLKQGGFDGCEVNAAHCHLIDQFWTAECKPAR